MTVDQNLFTSDEKLDIKALAFGYRYDKLVEHRDSVALGYVELLSLRLRATLDANNENAAAWFAQERRHLFEIFGDHFSVKVAKELYYGSTRNFRDDLEMQLNKIFETEDIRVLGSTQVQESPRFNDILIFSSPR